MIRRITRHFRGILNGMAQRADKLNYSQSAQRDFLKKQNLPYEYLKKNQQLKDIHKGKRCFIVGNAPSIMKQNLSYLENEYVFTVNFIYKNEQFPKMKSNYHFFLDPGCFTEGKYTPKDFTRIITDENKPHCFFPIVGGYQYAHSTGIDKIMDISYLFDFIPFDKPFNVRGDISKGITGFYTVIQSAIVTAVYMGFEEIYLIGCDCTGIITDIQLMEGRSKIEGYAYDFDEKQQENLKKEYALNIKIGDTFAGWARIFKGYERLLAYCQSNGVKLYNATRGGILETLPRVNFEHLFKENI